MTSSTPKQHHDSQRTEAEKSRRGTDSTQAVGINQPAGDPAGGPGNSRDGHPKPPHSGKPS